MVRQCYKLLAFYIILLIVRQKQNLSLRDKGAFLPHIQKCLKTTITPITRLDFFVCFPQYMFAVNVKILCFASTLRQIAV